MSSNTVLTGGSSDFFSAVFSSWLHSYSVRPAGSFSSAFRYFFLKA